MVVKSELRAEVEVPKTRVIRTSIILQLRCDWWWASGLKPTILTSTPTAPNQNGGHGQLLLSMHVDDTHAASPTTSIVVCIVPSIAHALLLRRVRRRALQPMRVS